MNLKKIVQWVVVGFIAWYLITQPVAAGNFVHHTLAVIKQAGASLATFMNNV